MTLLRTESLTVRFGGVVANDAVSLGVAEGQVVGLIGPNGAGKTTFVDAITGYVPSTGSIELDGVDIGTMRPHERARRGLVRTFQSLELFEDLSVEDNLLVAAQPTRWYDPVLDVLRLNRVAPEVRHRVDRALATVGLAEFGAVTPAGLSHGQRKLVGVARALATAPRLVLLDEPAAGLDTAESRVLGERIRRLPEIGAAVLLIDHDMGLVFDTCDYVYVLDFGRIIAEGEPAAVRADPAVIEAYLGSSASSTAGTNTVPSIGEEGAGG
jgi:branched-chain amino acid transport system ATP-binding protein